MDWARYWLLLCSCITFGHSDKAPHRCSLGAHPGPYLVLTALQGTLPERWVALHGGISAALDWTQSSNGTVVLPTSGGVAPFDGAFLASRLHTLGLRFCLAGRNFVVEVQKRNEHLKLQLLAGPADSPDSRVLAYDARSTLATAHRMRPQWHFNASLAVWLPLNVAPSLVHHFGSGPYDTLESDAAQAALTLRFTSGIPELAQRMLKQHTGKGAVSVALDLPAMAGSCPYEEYGEAMRRIRHYLRQVPFVLFVLLQNGQQAPPWEASTMLSSLGASQTVILEQKVFSAMQRSNVVSMEVATSLEVATLADHFVGCAASLISMVVAERRKALDKTYLLTGRRHSLNIVVPKKSAPAIVLQSQYAAAGVSSRALLQPHVLDGREFFRLGLSTAKTPSDKFTTHHYDQMYGMFLFPLLRQAKASTMVKKLKVFEIGLGCDMNYGPGMSIYLWRTFFGDAVELWEADVDAKCVAELKRLGQLDNVNAVTGDQSQRHDLERWVSETGGNFDVIIDDGGHTNAQIQQTFEVLFHQALAPGGLYFIEDLQVGRHPYYWGERPAAIEMLVAWMDQLAIHEPYNMQRSPQMELLRRKHPLPPTLKWIFCQAEACALAKCDEADPRQCRPPVSV